MLELEENLRLLNSLMQKLNSLEETLAISSLKIELKNLQDESSKERFLGGYK
ncbi:MAG: hypothetical protein HFJ45_00580 [Clostridia bacterium]|nr:hypothetical protein [Clostridia bacterium]